jgi:hypothetical protein
MIAQEFPVRAALAAGNKYMNTRETIRLQNVPAGPLLFFRRLAGSKTAVHQQIVDDF